MTLGVTEDSNYSNIANAIRSVSASQTSQTMTPAEMAAAIQALKATWGHIDGNIADQTDLQTAISKVFLGTKNNAIFTADTEINANTLDVNTAYAIFNKNGVPILNIPYQNGGTLYTFCFKDQRDSNFENQLFFDENSNVYYRSKYNGSWSNWEKISTFNNAENILSDLPNSNKRKKIVILGDSITQGAGSTGYVEYRKTVDGLEYLIRGNGPDYPYADSSYIVGQLLYSTDQRIWYEATSGNGWAHKVKSYFEEKFNCDVYNYGMSGIGTVHLIRFIQNTELLNNADMVVVAIGTNDRGASLSTFYNNMQTVIRELKKITNNIVLLSPIPSKVNSETDYDRVFHNEDGGHIIKKVAYETNCLFLNMYEEFIDYCWYTNTTIDSLLADGLHPNDNGYEVMFKLFTKMVGLSRKRDGATW